MLSEVDATNLLKRVFPTSKINSPISYKGLYVFQVFSSDPDEGQYDPFMSVNQTTGEIKDFSVITDGNINDITNLFLKQKRGG